MAWNWYPLPYIFKFKFNYPSDWRVNKVFNTLFSTVQPTNMKSCSIILALCILFAIQATAQNAVRTSACADPLIVHQADSIKQSFNKDGFIIVKEAFVPMESEYEIPVIVPLTQGSWYQFVFIGDISSRLYEVRMFDWDEKQVIYQKKEWGDVDGNIISYSYIPNLSEYHMIKPLQVNKKKKQLCGYVMLFKKIKQP